MSPLIKYLLYLADSHLILSHRNSEWCGHGPVLEQDIAITNISLDLLGQARNYYQYAATLLGGNTTEDTLAYHRSEREFRNLLLTEQPRGDWAVTVLRQYFFSSFQQLLQQELVRHPDQQIAAIAAKSLKEIQYHLRWSSEWVVRLGDGTPESAQRLQAALVQLWPYTGECFIAADYETEAGIPVATLKDVWQEQLQSVLAAAGLTMPQESFMQTGGKAGVHTEHLGYVLADLQYVQRAYPGNEW